MPVTKQLKTYLDLTDNNINFNKWFYDTIAKLKFKVIKNINYILFFYTYIIYKQYMHVFIRKKFSKFAVESSKITKEILK